MSYEPRKKGGNGSFREELGAFLGRRRKYADEGGYSYDPDMSHETFEAGVAANGADKRISFRLWGYWMCGAAVHTYQERVVVSCQSEFFRRFAESELGTLLEGVYKRPVHFKTSARAA